MYPGTALNVVYNLAPCLVSGYMFYISPELLDLEDLNEQDRALLSGIFTTSMAALVKIINPKEHLFPMGYLKKKIKSYFSLGESGEPVIQMGNPRTRTAEEIKKEKITRAFQGILGGYLVSMGGLSFFSPESNNSGEDISLGISKKASSALGGSIIVSGCSYLWGAFSRASSTS